MKYKVGDIVEFDHYRQEGVGKVVAVSEGNCFPYLVYSKDLTFGHDASWSKFTQDNDNNWWFEEKQLKLVENLDKGKQVNSKDELIKELTEIYNELTEIPELKHVYAISMKVVTKALLHLLEDTKEDTKDREDDRYHLRPRVKTITETEKEKLIELGFDPEYFELVK